MPFFGSKKEKKNPPGSGKPAYPSQAYPSQAAYPTQGGYPSQPPVYPSQQMSGTPYGVAPGEQPPAYSPAGPTAGAAAPPPVAFPPPAGYGMPPQGYAYGPPQPMIQPGTQVIGYGQFDAGARFNSGASANIPPPPPGCAPNAAQVASMHGGTIHMSQAKAGFFTTSSDGGVSTHID